MGVACDGAAGSGHPGHVILDGNAPNSNHVFMRTTIDLPDNLFRQAKARAALDGISFKKLITSYVQRGLSLGSQPTTEKPRLLRSKLPIVRAATGRPLPGHSNADLFRILEEEEVAGAQDRGSA